MLPKRSRISKAEFPSSGPRRVLGGVLISLSLSPIPEAITSKESRFSAVVSKKTEPSAVGRNRLRRLAYASVEGLKHPPKPLFVVIHMKKPAAAATSEAIRTETLRLLEEAGFRV